MNRLLPAMRSALKAADGRPLRYSEFTAAQRRHLGYLVRERLLREGSAACGNTVYALTDQGEKAMGVSHG